MEGFTSDFPSNSSYEANLTKFIVQAVISKQNSRQEFISPVVLSSEWGEIVKTFHLNYVFTKAFQDDYLG